MNKIKECRLNKNLLQRELSSILNVRPNTLSYWEKGKIEPPFEKLIEIADYFNVTTDYLLGRSQPERDSPGVAIPVELSQNPPQVGDGVRV